MARYEQIPHLLKETVVRHEKVFKASSGSNPHNCRVTGTKTAKKKRTRQMNGATSCGEELQGECYMMDLENEASPLRAEKG